MGSLRFQAWKPMYMEKELVQRRPVSQSGLELGLPDSLSHSDFPHLSSAAVEMP